MPPDENIADTDPLIDTSIPTKNNHDALATLLMQEKMLEVFPFSEEELKTVLLCYEQYSMDAGFAAICQGNHKSKTETVEQMFLPEAPCLLRQTIADAFVFSSSGYDDTAEFKFLEAIAALVGRRGGRSLLQVMYRVARGNEEDATPEKLASLTYRLLQALQFLKDDSEPPQQVRAPPSSWVISLTERSGGKVSEAKWMDWVNAVAPQTYQVLGTFCHLAIFGVEHPFRSTCPPLTFPEADQEPALWKHPYQAVPAGIAMISPSLGGKWRRQYSSDSDGFSFAVFQKALLEYQGPTAILIQTTASDTFGFYTDYPWREGKQWFGQEADSFLFGLRPSLQYYGPTGGKHFNQYLHNPRSPSPSDLCGLAVGGISPSSPRLHITTNFERCKAGNMDGVYTSGSLLSNGELFFDIDVIEIWAVNASDEEYVRLCAAGQKQAEIREATRVMAAQVDRKQFLEDFQTGQYSNGLYKHRDQARGRHSFCADEDGKGYFISQNPPSAIDTNKDETHPETKNLDREDSCSSDVSGVYIDG